MKKQLTLIKKRKKKSCKPELHFNAVKSEFGFLLIFMRLCSFIHCILSAIDIAPSTYFPRRRTRMAFQLFSDIVLQSNRSYFDYTILYSVFYWNMSTAITLYCMHSISLCITFKLDFLIRLELPITSIQSANILSFRVFFTYFIHIFVFLFAQKVQLYNRSLIYRCPFHWMA